MGNYLMSMMGTLLTNQEEPRETEQEIDHNICVFCGFLSVRDTKSDTEESDGGNQDSLCR